MEYIFGARGAGKTSYLLRQLELDPESVLVVPHSQMERYISTRLREQGKDDLLSRVVTIRELPYCRTRFKRVYVDEIQLVLQELFKLTVVSGTDTPTTTTAL